MTDLKFFIIEKWPQRLKKSGLNQVKFAKLSGVSRQTLNYILNGKVKTPNHETIKKVEMTFKSLGI